MKKPTTTYSLLGLLLGVLVALLLIGGTEATGWLTGLVTPAQSPSEEPALLVEVGEVPDPAASGNTENESTTAEDEPPPPGRQPGNDGERLEDKEEADPQAVWPGERVPAQLPPVDFSVLSPAVAEEERAWRSLLGAPVDSAVLEHVPHLDAFLASAERYDLPLLLVVGLSSYLTNFGANPPRGEAVEPAPRDRDPEGEIDAGCATLDRLLAEAKGSVVRAVSAYRRDLSTNRLSNTDLYFASATRRELERGIAAKFAVRRVHPIIEFEGEAVAETFIAAAFEMSGVDLRLFATPSGHGVFVAAAGGEEMVAVLESLRQSTGLRPQNAIPGTAVARSGETEGTP